MLWLDQERLNDIKLGININADEAENIIYFLDELKTVLCNHYGEEIRENHNNQSVNEEVDF